MVDLTCIYVKSNAEEIIGSPLRMLFSRLHSFALQFWLPQYAFNIYSYNTTTLFVIYV